jgi:Grx4 family monothiol glutaredoxin
MDDNLKTRLEQLTKQAPVTLFMKGDRNNPQCGFSAEIVNILNSQNTTYSTFDIYGDEEVRQGLKEYSNWPTFPQLYINGKLIGGLDIVQEMMQNNELQPLLTSS